MNTNVITKKQIRETLVDFICQKFLVEKVDLPLDRSLIDAGIIDSIGLIEISEFITENYDFKVTVEQMTRQNFGSVLLITEFIDRNKL